MPDLPPTRTVDATDEYFGETVADPFRWLEDENDAEVQAWASGRDEHCRARLAEVPGRNAIGARIEALAQIGRVGGPALAGGKLFYQERTGGQDQPVLMVRDALNGEPRPLLDPNQWSADGTVALDWWHASDDGEWIVYGASPGGTEVSTLKVRRTDGAPVAAPLGDVAIERCRAADVAWLPDGSGFYYTRYPRPNEVHPNEENYHRHVYFHAADAAPDGSEDARVFGEGLPKERWCGCAASPDGRYLLITVVDGWSRSDLWVLDRSAGADAEPQPVVVDRDALYMGVAGNDGLYIVTNDDAPRYRVMHASWAAPGYDHWTELIPQEEGTLEGCQLAQDRLVVRELRDATHRLRVHRRDGTLERHIALPTLGTVGGCDVESDGSDVVFDFQSFTMPPGLYHARIAYGDADPAYLEDDYRPRLLHSVAGDAPAPDGFQVRQVRYTSKDGTSVPMFIAAPKGVEPGGDAPPKTLLWGYGGFNVSPTPTYSASILAWVERGGVFCLANLRGGGEYGEEWHKAGMLARKQNVFDDFAAAADWLVESGWTTRERLAIQGGSNGGLLIFATLTQRPDLCRAAVSQVPLADMLRYHKFQIARLWIPEYGSAEDPELYPVLRAYSPYHNIPDGAAFPATLIMTGESDTRVDPLHARKMCAALEAANGGDHPVLLRLERKAGHGQGMPLSKAVEGLVDVHCFLEEQLSG